MGPPEEMTKRTAIPSNVGPALHRQPHREAKQAENARVMAVADEIFDRFVAGESYQAIADSLRLGMPGWRLRQILRSGTDTAERYEDALLQRSHFLVEQALEFGRQAAAIGDAAGLRTAIDVNLKVAAKINVAYSDKAAIELTGKNGGALELKADLTLTAEQAYERLIRG